MSSVTGQLVPVIGLAGILLSAAVLAVTRRVLTALPVLLDFLLAAGLLRLSATLSWRSIVSAALIVAIRKVVSVGISAGARARRAT